MLGDTVEMLGDIVDMLGDTVEMHGDTVEMLGDTVEMKCVQLLYLLQWKQAVPLCLTGQRKGENRWLMFTEQCCAVYCCAHLHRTVQRSFVYCSAHVHRTVQNSSVY